MKRCATFLSLILCSGLLLAQSLVASTVMVTISASMTNTTISEKSLARAQQMVLDIEDATLGQAFNAGHIAFNIRASVVLAGSKDAQPTITSLAQTARAGGADFLIVCVTEASEVHVDAPLSIQTCTISLYRVSDTRKALFEKKIALTKGTRDTDLKALVIGPLEEIEAKL